MSRITRDSDWYQPPIGPGQLEYNARLMLQELLPKGWTGLGIAGLAAWARALTNINPAYTGSSYMPTGKTGTGLLSWDAAGYFPGDLARLGYASNSGGGQLDTFDIFGYNHLVNIGVNDPVTFFDSYIRANYQLNTQPYQQVNRIWNYVLSGWMERWVYDSLYSTVSTYAAEYLEMFNTTSTWLLFAFNQKKGGRKLIL